MSLMKQNIMESAVRFFAQKGYAATSIQDIASDCGIAKGTFYKFFDSKEELLIGVYDDRIQRMYDEAETIKADSSLSTKERFIRQTLHQLHYFTDLKFSLEEYKDLPQDAGKFAAYCDGWRARQWNYYRVCLLAAYGEHIEPRIWDLVVAYMGMMKEFSQVPLFVNQPLNLESAAMFIVERVGNLADGILKSKLPPVMQPSIMTNYVQRGLIETSVPAAKHREDLFESLRTTVEEIAVPNTRKAELTEVVQLLMEEAEKDDPKRMLIRTLLEFLQSQNELKNIVGQLNKLLV